MNFSAVIFSGIALILTFTFLLRGNADAEEVDLIFTSPRKIRMLLQTEEKVAQIVNEYIADERERLKDIEG